MKYLTVRYRESDSRTYTYSFPDDLSPAPKPGDAVLVDARGRVLEATIVEVGVPEPSDIKAKPITKLLGPIGSAEESSPSAFVEDDEIPF